MQHINLRPFTSPNINELAQYTDGQMPMSGRYGRRHSKKRRGRSAHHFSDSDSYWNRIRQGYNLKKSTKDVQEKEGSAAAIIENTPPEDNSFGQEVVQPADCVISTFGVTDQIPGALQPNCQQLPAYTWFTTAYGGQMPPQVKFGSSNSIMEIIPASGSPQFYVRHDDSSDGSLGHDDDVWNNINSFSFGNKMEYCFGCQYCGRY